METIMLVCVDSKDKKAGGKGKDHNKFYKASFDGSTIFYEYGRINQTSVKGSKSGNERDFNKLISSKEKKGYKRVDIHTGVNQNELVNKDNRIAKAISDNPEVVKMVNELVLANTHDLFEGKFDVVMTADGAIKTPLGILTSGTITKAEECLTQIMSGKTKPIAEYFTYIPHTIKVGQALSSVVTDWNEEYELFSKLKQSVEDYEKNLSKRATATIDDSEFQSLFNVKLRQATSDELKSISDLFESSKNEKHHRYASSLKVVGALAIEHTDAENQKYEDIQNKLGNVMNLWHGTSTQNVLNILRTGLFCPKTSERHYNITGRMFGDGIYQSDQSTKALNYATGFWGNGKRGEHAYMFLTETTMGHTFDSTKTDARSSNYAKYAREGKYNSIFVHGKTAGVLNNEMIVWDTDQVKLKYLVIFGK